jgi:hypothetical protein
MIDTLQKLNLLNAVVGTGETDHRVESERFFELAYVFGNQRWL